MQNIILTNFKMTRGRKAHGRRNFPVNRALVPYRDQVITKRTMGFSRELNFGSWSNLGVVHARSMPEYLKFTLTDIPGITTMAAVFDQFRIDKVTWTVVYYSDKTDRMLTIHSSYDPDGGTMTDPADILMRANRRMNTTTKTAPSVRFEGIPGTVDPTSLLVMKQKFHDFNGGVDLTWYSHVLVADTEVTDIIGVAAKPMVYCSIDFSFKGQR